ncbi:MAG: hypothetical protein QM579_08535 [Desulfovibrio sp.]|uniref:hypothetical protein n=1 Tax=Desulfovibrio sp. TaxID=885 RepID=UPI0039E4CCF3
MKLRRPFSFVSIPASLNGLKNRDLHACVQAAVLALQQNRSAASVVSRQLLLPCRNLLLALCRYAFFQQKICRATPARPAFAVANKRATGRSGRKKLSKIKKVSHDYAKLAL